MTVLGYLLGFAVFAGLVTIIVVISQDGKKSTPREKTQKHQKRTHGIELSEDEVEMFDCLDD